MNIKYTQKQLKQLVEEPKLTQKTNFFEGMHIYTILKSENDGAMVRKGYNLIADEILLKPNNGDWEAWQKDPDNSNQSYFFNLDQDDYWVLADADDLTERSIMSTQAILNMELSQKKNNIFVTYSN